MNCNKTDCIHYEVCQEWRALGNDNYINDSYGNCENYTPNNSQGDLIKAFELLKAHCKNRECNKDCVFYRELRAGNDIEQFCGLCEIVMSDDKEVKKNDK